MKYYVDGYTPPEDVKSYEDVKRYQKLLGVEIDGIWGKKTQAAYDQYQKQNNNLTKPTEGSIDGYPFGGDIDWEAISNKLSEYFAGIMRPSIDAAITKRQKTSDTYDAELDADSYARGMGSSTFVSSMKSRQEESEQDDIAYMEGAYSQALAAQVYDSLMKLGTLYSNQKIAQEELQLQREKMQQEQARFDAQMNSKSNGTNKQESNSQAPNPYVSGLTYSDYYKYVSNLGEQAEDFFYSEDAYWQFLRSQAIFDLGEAGFYQLMNSFTKKEEPEKESNRKRNNNENREELY
ncbi:MAG: hypothetical protein GX802_08385 [Clostridiales bacterium]|nr:hypothetical protein [Clostridiales bacterium]